jgi:hypothetical protein
MCFTELGKIACPRIKLKSYISTYEKLMRVVDCSEQDTS